MLIMLKNV